MNPTRRKVAIVSPGYPGLAGGVTDHTARLASHWSRAGCEVAVLGTTAGQPQQIVEAWRGGGVQAILIQYVPFLYARSGLSSFPEQIAAAASDAGLRTTVFVHEPWVPPTRVPWFILSPLQQRQLRRLLRVAQTAVTPVPAWRQMLGDNVFVMHVGSTLGEPEPRPTDASDLTPPVVFSPLAAGLNWDWIVAAARAVGAQPALIVVGVDWATARRHPLLKRWADPSWDWRGWLDAQAVLALLARARLVLAPFVGGLTGRRTSALGAASVGARVLSSRGPQFDEAFTASPFALAGNKAQFCELARSLVGAQDTPEERRARIEWYDQRLSPISLDRTLLELMLGTAP